MGSPCLKIAAADPQTEQAARYARVLRMTATAKARGCQTVHVKLTDLEALIAIAAATDASVSR